MSWPRENYIMVGQPQNVPLSGSSVTSWQSDIVAECHHIQNCELLGTPKTITAAHSTFVCAGGPAATNDAYVLLNYDVYEPHHSTARSATEVLSDCTGYAAGCRSVAT